MRLDGHVALLARVAFFSGMSRDQLNTLAFMGGRRQFQPGEFLLRRGEPAPAAYVVMSGNVTLEGGGANGDSVRFGPGGAFAELAMLLDTTSDVSVAAVDKVSALEFTRPVTQAILQHDPGIATHFAEQLRARLRAVSHQLEDLARALQSDDLEGEPAAPHAPISNSASTGA